MASYSRKPSLSVSKMFNDSPPPKQLVYLDIMLFFIGLKLFVSTANSLVGPLNKMLRVLFIFDVYSSIIIIIVQMSTGSGLTLYGLTYIIFYAIAAWLHHHLHYYHSDIKVFFADTFANRIHRSELDRLRRTCLKIFVTWLICVIGHIVVNVLFWYSLGTAEAFADLTAIKITKAEWYHKIVVIVKLFGIIMFSSMIYATSAFLYLFFASVTHAADKSFYLNYCANYRTLSNSYTTLTKLRKEMTKTRDDFRSKLDVMPFLWLVFIFMLSVGFVVLTIENKGSGGKDRIYISSEWLQFSIYMIVIFATILISDNYNKSSKRLIGNFVNVLSAENDSEMKGSEMSKLILIDELEDHTAFRLNAWSFFKLGRPLLLSFSGALISFAVLISQMN